MVEITVCGEAVERASAERATVTVHSRWGASSAEAAMRVVADAHERLVAEATSHVDAGAAESWQADRVGISHSQEWVGEGEPRRSVYTASASVTVRFIDFEALGMWIGRVGMHDVHEVGGIQWSLSEQTERDRARAARTRAVADAVERAADYAAAAALGAPVVDSIQEPGTTPPVPLARGVRMEAMALAGAPGAAPAISFEAGVIEVHAAVEVRFVAEPLRHMQGSTAQ
ncbi:SIMPL domain-containing protein [Agrococcus sp. ProA11]|uniref:SIMPL domain-containing protein n=1 Tax=Agrococcus chionoecetis TaxID=3153752 RepID=UPI0032614917